MTGFGIYSVKLPFYSIFHLSRGSAFVIEHIATVILNGILTSSQRLCPSQ